ncbi:hypothetical protein LOZ86_18715 [Pectobacterium parvum]|nr:CDP-alcohol phosphatidyltransferase family protein [Pectobacterium parvum]UFK41414.1 hypothetical protein LOZ86_18715 [Pectobacterium parvum]UVD99574.1 hypothetical protein NV347_18740 [Pectobacterium parvum]
MIFNSILSDNIRTAIIWMMISILIDLTDGTLARSVNVTRYTPFIDGVKMDYLVDFINVTFLPLILIYKAGWIPNESIIFISVPLIASLFNYCLVKKKAHSAGFFQGFPAFYSILCLYLYILDGAFSRYLIVVLLHVVAIAELLPIMFLRARGAYKYSKVVNVGGTLWLIFLLAIFYTMPKYSYTLVMVSLIYPLLYVILSIIAYHDYKNNFKVTQGIQ